MVDKVGQYKKVLSFYHVINEWNDGTSSGCGLEAILSYRALCNRQIGQLGQLQKHTKPTMDVNAVIRDFEEAKYASYVV